MIAGYDSIDRKLHITEPRVLKTAEGQDRNQPEADAYSGCAVCRVSDVEGGKRKFATDAPDNACNGRSRRWHTARLHIRGLMRPKLHRSGTSDSHVGSTKSSRLLAKTAVSCKKLVLIRGAR